MERLAEVLRLLGECGSLPEKYKPHKLSGSHKDEWECHIQPDWMLVWKQNDEELILILISTGSHSDLFG